jgi:hypothetical protein
MALKESGISGTSEAVCFAKGWEAAMDCAAESIDALLSAVHERELGRTIAYAISTLKE